MQKVSKSVHRYTYDLIACFLSYAQLILLQTTWPSDTKAMHSLTDDK